MRKLILAGLRAHRSRLLLAALAIGGTLVVLDHATGTPRTFRVTGLLDVRGQGQFALRGALGFTHTAAVAVTGGQGYAEIAVARRGFRGRDGRGARRRR